MERTNNCRAFSKIRAPVQHRSQPGNRVGIPAAHEMNNSDVILRWPVVRFKLKVFSEILDCTLALAHREQGVSHVVPCRPVLGILLDRPFIVSQGSAPILLPLLDDSEVIRGLDKIRLQFHRVKERRTCLREVGVQIRSPRLNQTRALPGARLTVFLPERISDDQTVPRRMSAATPSSEARRLLSRAPGCSRKHQAASSRMQASADIAGARKRRPYWG